MAGKGKMTKGKPKGKAKPQTKTFKEKVSKALDEGVRYINCDYFDTMTMNSANHMTHTDYIIRDIPRYNPQGGTTREVKTNYSRQSNKLFIKGMKLGLTLWNTSGQNGLIRCMLIHNTSPHEQLNVSTYGNLFHDAYGEDWAPSNDSAVLPLQPINPNLFAGGIKSGVLYDKIFQTQAYTYEMYIFDTVSELPNKLYPARPDLKNTIFVPKRYYKIGKVVEWEGDAVNDQLKAGKFYWIVLYGNPLTTEVGDVVVTHQIEFTLAEA